MKREQIDALLASYRENSARAEFLRIRVNDLTALLEELKKNASYYLTSTTQAYTTDPRGAGGVPQSKVEKLAVMMADGVLPGELGDVERELNEARDELNDRERAVALVNSWLGALQGRERYVMDTHILDGQVWREVSVGFKERFREEYSPNGLKGILKKGLKKIYRIAM